MIKRSLCNTFGACGAKRSLAPTYQQNNGMDELVDDSRPSSVDAKGSAGGSTDTNLASRPLLMTHNLPDSSSMFSFLNSAKLIDEILDEIIEHLKLDQTQLMANNNVNAAGTIGNYRFANQQMTQSGLPKRNHYRYQMLPSPSWDEASKSSQPTTMDYSFSNSPYTVGVGLGSNSASSRLGSMASD